MESKDVSKVWRFNFFLEDRNYKEVDIDVPAELLEYILEWVEKHGYQMGGGFQPFDDEDDSDIPR